MTDLQSGRSSTPAASEPTPQADKDWFGGRRWTGIGAIGVLIVIALCAALLIATGGGDSTAPTPPTGPAAPAYNPGAGDQQIPTAAPPDVTWTLYQSVALPSSPTAGPRNVFGDTATGYAHTPTGALVAAQQISTRRFLAYDADYRAAAEAMLAPGPGRDAWLSKRATISHATSDPPGTYTQVAGFNFLSYTDTDAVIQLASKSANGSLSLVTEHLVWLDNDWKLVLTPDGGEANNQQTLSSLAGFVPWSGV